MPKGYLSKELKPEEKLYLKTNKNQKRNNIIYKKQEHRVFRKGVEPPCMVWTLDFEFKDEITVQGTKDTKVKVIFQGPHMICVMPALVYNLKFCLLNTPFNITF